MNKSLWLLILTFGLLSCQSESNQSKSSVNLLPAQNMALGAEPDSGLGAAKTENQKPERAPFALEVLLGQIDQSKNDDFVHIDPKYTNKPNIFLRKDAYASFLKMHTAAKADGVNLTIISATRNFNYQKGIWERKWNGSTKVGGKNLALTISDPVERARTILQYSSMPGTSRHHWGTDIDLNSLNNSWFESGSGKKLYDWLSEHAGEYGFCQTYCPIGENRPYGYLEEPWHWSYMPLASVFLKDYLTMVNYEDITGFDGSEAAEGMQVIDHFVGGINPECK